MNYRMFRAALAVAVGLVAVCYPAAAQQSKSRLMHQRTASLEQLHRPATAALTLYQPKNFSGNDSSFLLRNGPLLPWLDGGRLASQNALAEIGMASLDFFPAGYLPPDNFASAQPARGHTTATSRPQDFGPDPKDMPEMMSPPDHFYYGGEVGFMYGHWSGKGGGDSLQSYIFGQAGNDHFQITAGASYEDWNAHGSHLHAFAVPR